MRKRQLGTSWRQSWEVAAAGWITLAECMKLSPRLHARISSKRPESVWQVQRGESRSVWLEPSSPKEKWEEMRWMKHDPEWRDLMTICRQEHLWAKGSDVWVWLAHVCGWNSGWLVWVVIGEDVAGIRRHLSSSLCALGATINQTWCFRKITVLGQFPRAAVMKSYKLGVLKQKLIGSQCRG